MEILKPKEIQVLSILRKNSKISLTDINAITSIPIATLHDMIKRFKHKGIIKKFYSVLDNTKIGYPIKVFSIINPKEKECFINLIFKSVFLNNMFKISNGFMVEFLFDNLNSYESQKEIIISSGVNSYSDHIVVEEYKIQVFFPVLSETIFENYAQPLDCRD